MAGSGGEPPRHADDADEGAKQASAGASAEWFNQAVAREPLSRRVPVDNCSIHCLDWGGADRPALLLVHGYLGHARWWAHIAPAFADSHRVIAMDLSGMGDSGRRERYTHDQYSREIIAVIEALDLAPVTLIAHSYGGVPSTLAAIARPELFERLLLLDSRLPFPGASPYRRRTLKEGETFADFETALSRFKLWPPGEWPDPNVIAHIARHSICARPGGYGWKFDSRTGDMFAEPMSGIDPADLRVPATYIVGELSEVVSMDEARSVVAQLPDCVGPLLVERSHHHLMIEQPLSLIEAIGAALDRRR